MAKGNTYYSGQLGVFMVGTELASRELIVSMTARNARGADLLVTDPDCSKTYSVQVKAQKGNPSFWLLNKDAKETVSSSHIYVFVNINDGVPRFYVVPSKTVANKLCIEKAKTGKKQTWYSYSRDEKYLAKWDAFKEGHAPPFDLWRE